MAETLLQAGTSAGTSESISLGASESVVLFLSPGAGKRSLPLGAVAYVEAKDADGRWVVIDALTAQNFRRISGPVVVRVRRPGSQFAFGVTQGSDESENGAEYIYETEPDEDGLLPLPPVLPGEQVVYLLLLVRDGYYYQVDLEVYNGYSVDWGDGSEVEISSEGGYLTHGYTFGELDIATAVTFEDTLCRQAIIKVEALEGESLIGVMFEYSDTEPN